MNYGAKKIDGFDFDMRQSFILLRVVINLILKFPLDSLNTYLSKRLDTLWLYTLMGENKL